MKFKLMRHLCGLALLFGVMMVTSPRMAVAAVTAEQSPNTEQAATDSINYTSEAFVGFYSSQVNPAPPAPAPKPVPTPPTPEPAPEPGPRPEQVPKSKPVVPTLVAKVPTPMPIQLDSRSDQQKYLPQTGEATETKFGLFAGITVILTILSELVISNWQQIMFNLKRRAS